MTVGHRGHTIDVRRATSGRGGTVVAFSIVRVRDGYECTSGVWPGNETVHAYLGYLKNTIDDEEGKPDPWCEQAERNHPFDTEIDP